MPKLPYNLTVLRTACFKLARTRAHKVYVREMFTTTGCLLPMKSEHSSHALISFQALLARISKLTPIQQVGDTTEFACFRIPTPYLGPNASVYDPNNPIQFTSDEDQELADMEDDPLAYIKVALGDLYNPREFDEPPVPLTKQQELEAAVDAACRIPCQHCHTPTNADGESYINKADVLTSLCQACRARGVTPLP